MWPGLWREQLYEAFYHTQRCTDCSLLVIPRRLAITTINMSKRLVDHVVIVRRCITSSYPSPKVVTSSVGRCQGTQNLLYSEKSDVRLMGLSRVMATKLLGTDSERSSSIDRDHKSSDPMYGITCRILATKN